MNSLLMEDIDYILKCGLKKEKYEVLCLDEEGSRNISGFLGATSKVCIHCKEGDQIQDIHVFLKRLPVSRYHCELITSIGAFDREVNIYNKFLSIFAKYIPDISYPMCYIARPNNLIVLEDLSYQGFKTLDVSETYDLEHCEKVVEAISKFHASSIIFEVKMNCKIDDIMPSLQKPIVIHLEADRGKNFYFTGVKALRKIIPMCLSKYSKEIIEKSFKYFETMPNELGPSQKFLNVLTHGDVWGNNIMFKYDSDNKVSKVCLIDFQFCSYTAFAFDLLMLLHNCTTSEFRKQHKKYLIKYYYSQLFGQLSKVNINLENIMTWSDFEESVKEITPQMLAIANICLPFALMPQEVLQEVLCNEEKFKNYMENDRDCYVLQALEKSNIYKCRVLDALTAFLDYFKEQ